MFLFEDVFVFVTQRHDAGHVHLVIGGQHGGGVLRVFQAAGDGGAEAGHLDALFAGGVIGRDGRARDGGGGRGGAGGGGDRGGGAGHVLFHHAAIAARALDLIGREARFGHGLFRGGGVFHVLGGGRGGSFRGLNLGCGGCGGGPGGTFGHDGEARLGVHGRAFGGEDFGQDAGDRRGNLNRDFVGFKFAQHLVLFHRIADLFEPGRDGGLRYAFAQAGHHNIGHDLLLPPGDQPRASFTRVSCSYL